MRCLFFPDEFAAFRPVAAAIQDLQLEFVMLRDTKPARLALDLLPFDVIIIGANSIDSKSLRFLRLWTPSDVPRLGVTCVPWMCEELSRAGADQTVLLPDQTEHLGTAVKALLKMPLKG
jgi:hypothetical protein